MLSRIIFNYLGIASVQVGYRLGGATEMAGNAAARRPSFGYAQDRLPEAARETKTSSTVPTDTARKPREFILSEAKDGVVGVRVFPDVLFVITVLEVLVLCLRQAGLLR